MQKSVSSKLVLKISRGVLNTCFNILFYAVVIVLIINASKYSYNFAYQVFGSMSVDAEPGRDVEIQILKGESTLNIAKKLEVSNVILNQYSFYVKTKLKEYNIMPGTYIVNSSMDYDELLAVITDISNSTADEESIEDFDETP